MKTLPEVLKTLPQDIVSAYDYSAAVYVNALSPITNILCPTHGAFAQYSGNLRKGTGCPACGNAKRSAARTMDSDEFYAKVSEIHGGEYEYFNKSYANMKTKIPVICKQHGEFLISPIKHMYSKQGCPECGKLKRGIRTSGKNVGALAAATSKKKHAAQFLDSAKAAHGDTYDYSQVVYNGMREKVTIVCKEHGPFEQTPYKHLKEKQGCPKCGAYDPKWERDLSTYIQGFGMRVERSVPILNGQHIDLYITDSKIGIELHGLHWHKESKRGKMYHRNKWEVATDKGIRLLQIFEDEWVEKQEIVKARIEAILGASERFDARKCLVEKIDSERGREFLSRHHIQGPGNASVYYGLTYNHELVAVASFCKARSGAMTGSNKEGSWEVLRYASIGRVRGGFTRMYKQFLESVNPDEVISYCDLRYGDGKLYAAAGFALDSITEPDYWWVPNGKVQRIPRYATQKHKLDRHPVLKAYYAPGKTEAQVCAEAGWEKIYGVGNQKWIWNKNS